MFYAHLTNSEGLLTARFYTRVLRDDFCETTGAVAVRSRAAKFVAGADRCVTYWGKDNNGYFTR